MSNSSLIDCVVMSPNHSGRRTHRIDTITPHCVVGQLKAENIGACFPAGRGASCNYGIGTEGRICLIVDEENRSWCSSSNANDQRAITIECASDMNEPYAMNSTVYNKLIKLCVDICKRNGIKKLLWCGSKEATLNYTPGSDEAVLTAHRWFANKSCPGDWLYSRYEDLAKQVTAQLGGSAAAPDGKTQIIGAAKATVKQMQNYIKSVNSEVTQSVVDMIPYYISEGTTEGIRGDIAFAQSCLETGNFGFKGSAITLDQNNFCGMGATSNGMKGNSFASPQMGIRAQIQHLKAYANNEGLKNECIDPRFKYVQRGVAPYVEWLGIQENPSGKGWASGANYGQKIIIILNNVLKQPGDTATPEPTPPTPPSINETATNYLVRVSISDLNIRTGPGTNYGTNGQTGVGTFTIVAEADGPGASKWGKLKSNAGWISLDYAKKADSSNSSSASTPIKKGDRVRVNDGAKSYTGQSIASFVYNNTYTVDELNGSRAVLGIKSICTAFNVKDLKKV